jgi:hypothetical protein
MATIVLARHRVHRRNGADVQLHKGQHLETRPRQSLAAWFSNLENRFLPKLVCQLDKMVLYYMIRTRYQT